MRSMQDECSCTRDIVLRVRKFFRFLDSDYFPSGAENVRKSQKRMELDRAVPFAFLHLCCGLVFLSGASGAALVVCATSYFVRMFAITAFYHRYFSHRTFNTSRFAQFCFAFLGATAVQRGPLWWAAHHRDHHKFSDKSGDVHSPVQESFFWSHMGWILSSANMPTNYSRVPDFNRFPELRFINRFDWAPPVIYAVMLLEVGNYISVSYPSLHTSGFQFVVWGFFVSTVLLFHATASINSFAHKFGTQRFDTGDASRNNFVLAILTLGEGWHNNHHFYPGSVRQGLRWYEIDISYMILRVLEMLGVVRDLRSVPQNVLVAHANKEDLPQRRSAERSVVDVAGGASYE